MKPLFIVLAFTWASIWQGGAAWAQGNTSRTYFGNNGPQGGQQPGSSYGPSPTPDKFVVNVYGRGNEFAFEVKSQGGDICGRPYYFTGTVIFPANSNKGSIDGPMLRCTNKELKDACKKKGITLTDYYEVGFTGTVERSPDHTRYIITITYPYTIWVKEDCTEKLDTQGEEMIMLSYQSPLPPEPTTREQIDRARKKAVDTMYKSVRGGEWLKNRPR